MRKHLISTAVATALLFGFGCEQASSPLNAAETPKATSVEEIRDQTLVTVNGQNITGEMFGIYLNERMRKAPGAKNTPELQNQAINELINILLLSQAATKEGLDKRQDVATLLKMQSDQTLSRLAMQEYLLAHQPAEETLKKSYDETFAKQGGEEYRARHILVKTEDEAKQLIEQINNGEDFAELAKQHSTGPTGPKGGELGWFDAAQMVKPFADAVKGAKVDKVIQTPIKTQFGWHVIELEEKRAKEPPTFEAVKQQLATEAQRNTLAEYMNQLRGEAKIEINEKLAKKPEGEKEAAAKTEQAPEAADKPAAEPAAAK